MKLTGAQAMVTALKKENISTVFGYPGAAICPFYDALLDSGIDHILTRHEQGAAHAANGYSRASGGVGVCVATSGPGATNLLTGIATAYLDSIPLIAITGQVETGAIGKDVFQEVDITGASEPFTKYSYLIKKAEDIPRIFKEAFYIASTGRPGPVLIDVPVDIQKHIIDAEFPDVVDIRGYKPGFELNEDIAAKIINALCKAKRPVICAGGGVITSNAKEKFTEFVEKLNIPVVTTLMGIGAMDKDHRLNLGMLGSHGVYTANYAINHADCIMVLGARIGDRAMGKIKTIRADQILIHIDIDDAEIGKNVPVDIPLVCDAKSILDYINKKYDAKPVPVENGLWCEDIAKIKAQKAYNYDDLKGSGHIRPQLLFKELSEMLGEDDIITTEVGQNQIWAANHIDISRKRKLLSSGGLGTMGYGLPCAMGAKASDRRRRVIEIAGDGSIQMSIAELATIAANDLAVKILLINNSKLGMVRELQAKLFEKRYCATCLEGNPDFMKIAEAYGIKSKRITMQDETQKALVEMLEHDGPFLLECVIDKDEETLC